MFSRGESSRIREAFWTTFGKYMSPVLSAEGMKINWINYHTGIKDVYFRMDTGRHANWIGISLEHRDAAIRELYFEQFLELKTMLQLSVEEEWIWQRHATSDGKSTGRIYMELKGPSVYNKEHWHSLISFFKPRIIALDEFWANGKYAFEALK